MGMFSSLFGSSGSDKADKFRQQAIDAFNAVKTPDLASLQVQLQDSVLAGKITPEEAEAQLLGSNAFNAIKTDPSSMGAQKQALLKLQQTGEAGGLDAIDKSKLQSIRDAQMQENRSSNEAIMASARARGTGNSNLNTVNSLIQQQASADRASREGTDVAAQSQARALQALVAAGQLGGSMDAQQFAQGAAKATAQNDIDKFNAANKNDISKFNVTNDLTAQGANVTNAQHVQDLNTATQNAGTIRNADANQTVFNDEMAKAAGKAGTLNQWAGDATAAKRAETGADMALVGGAINAGAAAGGYAMGGPAGGAVASGAFKPKNPTEDAINSGYVRGYAEGGEVQNPTENVAPPSSIEDEYAKFMQSFSCGGTVNMSDGGKVTVKPGKKRPEQPVQATTPLPIISNQSEEWTLSDPNNDPIGDFSNYSDAADFAEKVKEKQPRVQDFLDGGKVKGTPVVEGDSPKNDTVPAKLSPGEVVIPRTDVAELEKKIGDPLVEALKRLKNPQVGSVRG